MNDGIALMERHGELGGGVSVKFLALFLFLNLEPALPASKQIILQHLCSSYQDTTSSSVKSCTKRGHAGDQIHLASFAVHCI